MKNALLVFSVLLLLLNCQKDDIDPVQIADNPTKALLVFPYENSECNEGTNITATESTVLFEWKPAENTDEYELILSSLSKVDQASYMTTGTQIPVVLKRGTPYSWYVVSRSNKVDSTAQSETWKFYNAGEGIESYAPFPAEIITPLMAETISSPSGEITLDWDGSDADNDIVGYDVYFGITNPPDLFVSNLQESVLTDVKVESGSVYYWSVTTKDARGNSSESGIYQFKIL
jgi:hypothetical protein